MPETRQPHRRTRRPQPSREAAGDQAPARKLVLLAGASGTLGGHILRALAARGYRVRALVRAPERLKHDVDEVFAGDLVAPGSLKGACEGVEAVVSCAGAKLGLVRPGRGGYSYAQVDDQGNRSLLAEARAAGVKKFVYVSVYGGRFLPASEYIRAHESAAAAVKASGMDYAVLRPTRFFAAYARTFHAAKKGRVTIVGDGAARANPIAEEDVAALCADALEGHRGELDVGGPDTFTLREIGELAFRVVEREPRFRRVPMAVAGLAVRLAGCSGQHNADTAQFMALASVTDLVAPAAGKRRLEDYFRELAAS